MSQALEEISRSSDVCIQTCIIVKKITKSKYFIFYETCFFSLNYDAVDVLNFDWVLKCMLYFRRNRKCESHVVLMHLMTHISRSMRPIRKIYLKCSFLGFSHRTMHATYGTSYALHILEDNLLTMTSWRWYEYVLALHHNRDTSHDVLSLQQPLKTTGEIASIILHFHTVTDLLSLHKQPGTWTP